MKFVRALCVLCVLCGSVVLAVALDREAFSFTNYNLEVRIEPEQQRLGVRGHITLRNDSDSAQKNVVLQISSSLNWSSIQLEGKPVDFISQIYSSDIDHTGALTEAIVTLPRPLPPKQTIELGIGYEGIIPKSAMRLMRIGVPADVAGHSDWDEIRSSFTALRGIGYVAWYPIATEAASLSEANSVSEAAGRWKQKEANAEMRVKFSRSGATSGDLRNLYCSGAEPVVEHEQMGRSHESLSECVITRLDSTIPSFVIGSYSSTDRPTANISYLPGHRSVAEDYALAVDETSPLVEKWFGDHRVKPESKAEVIELPDPDAAPFESGGMLLTPLGGQDATLLLSSIHLLTRVAFPSPRAWIRDGLAGYAQLSFLQERADRGAVITYLQNHRSPLLESEKEIPGKTENKNKDTQRSLINATDEFYVQAKAASVWWMLRDLVGEAALNAALHSYRAGEDVRTDYMQKLIEKQSHRDLEWFFDDWVYRDRGLPDFRIVSVYPRPLVAGGYMVTVMVENLGAAAAEAPVILRMAEGEVSEPLLVAGHSQASVRIQAASLPQEVTVNDGSVPETDTSNNT
ncbi:MAG TPA: hypothetical protein VIL63_07920, partial [Terriglobales bacterium]